NTSDAGHAAGAGGGAYFLMGNAGTAPTSLSVGGDFDVVLGQGNGPQPPLGPFGNGRNGQFQVYAPWLSQSPPYALNGPNQPVVIIGSLGLGIGAGPNLGTPLNCVWSDVDPTYSVSGLVSSENLTLSVDLLTNYAMQNQASGIHLFGPGAITNTGGNGSADDEIHIYSTGTPTHAYIRGSYSKVHLENYQAAVAAAGFGPGAGFTNTPTAANITLAYGVVGELVHEGTGTIATAVGVLGSVVVQKNGHGGGANQGANDGIVTE